MRDPELLMFASCMMGYTVALICFDKCRDPYVAPYGIRALAALKAFGPENSFQRPAVVRNSRIGEEVVNISNPI